MPDWSATWERFGVALRGGRFDDAAREFVHAERLLFFLRDAWQEWLSEATAVTVTTEERCESNGGNTILPVDAGPAWLAEWADRILTNGTSLTLAENGPVAIPEGMVAEFEATVSHSGYRTSGVESIGWIIHTFALLVTRAELGDISAQLRQNSDPLAVADTACIFAAAVLPPSGPRESISCP
jgi:hypothetical protein